MPHAAIQGLEADESGAAFRPKGAIRNGTLTTCLRAAIFRLYSKYGIGMKADQAIQALSALAHENRLGIYRMLVEAGPDGLNAGSIAARLRMPPSSLTFHLQQLHRAGLVAQARNSRQLIYAADFAVMNDLVAYLTENCCGGAAACATDCAPSAPKKRSVRRTGKASMVAS